MKRFLLSILLVTLGFSGMAQIFPDSNAGPCFIDFVVTNQGNMYTVDAISGDSNTTNYTWTINGTVDTSITGFTYSFNGVVGSTEDICVSIPCDTIIVDFCTTIYVDSNGNNPIDSLDYGCLVGISTSGQNGYLSATADFNGMLYNSADLVWYIDGVATQSAFGDYMYAPMAAGSYYVCATYDSDSCTVTYCDTVVVTDPVNPIDSLDYGCLTGLYTYGQAGYFSAYADFDSLLYDPSDISWTVDGVSNPMYQGDYIFAQVDAGTYYVCVTYDNDSCTVTFCDSVVVTDPGNPIDSLDAGCLTNVTASGFGSQYFFTADFDNPNGILSDVEWSIDGTVASGVTGPYLTWVFADGDYTVCASYTTDSCTNVVCIDITVDGTINGNDSIIFIDSVGFGNWVYNNWDSLYVDSTLLDELEDWDLDEWSDSLLDIFFGDSININDFDSNDIYVLLDGLTQDQIDSLLSSGVVGLDLGELDEYWEDFLEENEGIDTLGLTFNDLLGLFADYIEAKATAILSVKEVTSSNIDIFFNRQTSTLTIDSDQIGQINVYNIQGQRVLSQNNNNPQLNLSSINTGLYILSIEINGKLYSHKIVK